MARDVEELWSPPNIVFGQIDLLDGALLINRVDFNSHLEVGGQGNNLNVISVDIQLFHFTCTETCNISTNEVLVQDRIFL